MAAAEQLAVASSSAQRRSQALVTLRFRCAPWAFAFIREGLQRYPIVHPRFSAPLPGDSWWHYPRAPHVLEPGPAESTHPLPGGARSAPLDRGGRHRSAQLAVRLWRRHPHRQTRWPAPGAGGTLPAGDRGQPQQRISHNGVQPAAAIQAGWRDRSMQAPHQLADAGARSGRALGIRTQHSSPAGWVKVPLVPQSLGPANRKPPRLAGGFRSCRGFATRQL